MEKSFDLFILDLFYTLKIKGLKFDPITKRGTLIIP
jgi:hypothetical protein